MPLGLCATDTQSLALSRSVSHTHTQIQVNWEHLTLGSSSQLTSLFNDQELLDSFELNLHTRSEVTAGVFDSTQPDPSPPLVFSFSFMLQQASSAHAQPLWGLFLSLTL